MKLSILHRLLLVFLAMAAVLGEVFLHTWGEERDRLEKVTQEGAEIHRRVFERAWEVQARSIVQFADDASRREELVAYVKNPSPDWLQNNLAPATFENGDAEYIWVIGLDGRQLGRAAKNPALGIPELEIDWPILIERVKKEDLVRFFYRLDTIVIEVAAAGIVSGADRGRSLEPQGILLAARLIDHTVFERLHELSRFRVGLLTKSTPEIPFSVDGGGDIWVYLPLSGLTGEPVAWLSGALSRDFFLEAAENQQNQWLKLVLGNLAFFLVVALLLWLWVGRPMQLLSDSLAKGDAQKLQSLRRTNSELGRFAGVLAEFYEDKERLAEEVRERKAAEVALREREQLFGTIFEQAEQVIVLLTPDGEVQKVNSVATSLTGLPEERWLGQHIQTLPIWQKSSGAGERLGEAISAALAGDTSQFELELRKPEGDPVQFSFSLKPVYVDEKRVEVWRLLLEGNDLSAFRKMEAEVIQAGEEERARIGLNLHDGLCQELTAADFSIRLSQIRLEKGEREGFAELNEARGLLSNVISQARDLARLLTPVVLVQKGLAIALDELAVNARKMFSIECEVRCDGPLSCDEDIAKHLYRIVQEGIQNAVRHGKASRIEIELVQDSGGMVLEIADNGRGIDPTLLEVWNSSRDHGLKTMKYRMRLIGGSLTLSLNEPHGLLVSCYIPIA